MEFALPEENNGMINSDTYQDINYNETGLSVRALSEQHCYMSRVFYRVIYCLHCIHDYTAIRGHTTIGMLRTEMCLKSFSESVSDNGMN